MCNAYVRGRGYGDVDPFAVHHCAIISSHRCNVWRTTTIFRRGTSLKAHSRLTILISRYASAMAFSIDKPTAKHSQLTAQHEINAHLRVVLLHGRHVGGQQAHLGGGGGHREHGSTMHRAD